MRIRSAIKTHGALHRGILSLAIVAALAAGVLLRPAASLGSQGMMQLTAQLETFRLESTDKLEELYTLRKVYIDSNNTAGTEGTQIFIGELRTNVFLVSNVLDILFLYRMHRVFDDKGLMAEYVTSRLEELLDSLRYNIRKMDDLAEILAVQGQETLAEDFATYRVSLIGAADAVDSIERIISAMNQDAEDEQQP